MSELFAKIKFIEDNRNKKTEVIQELSNLKNISYLHFVVFVDRHSFCDFVNNDQIKSHLEERHEDGVCQTTMINFRETEKILVFTLKYLYNQEYETKMVFEFFILSTEESTKKLCDLTQIFVGDQSNPFENAGVKKSDLLMFLNSLNVWSFGFEFENQLVEETLLHHYLLQKNKLLVSYLVNFGCQPSLKRFIMRFDNETIEFMANNNCISRDVLETQFPFHSLSYSHSCKPKQYYKLEDIFNSIVSCGSSGDLHSLFLLKSPENKNLNAIEYACRIQADKIFELILNTEKGLKLTDQAVNYDVSNLIPDTLVSYNEDLNDEFTVLALKQTKYFDFSSQVSCLERIIASSENNERRASNLLVVKPMTFLIDQYILISKFIRCILFVLQTMCMIGFTYHNTNSVSNDFTKLLSFDKCNSKNSGGEEVNVNCTRVEFDNSAYFSVFWIFWPLFIFVFATYQFMAMSKMLLNCDVKRSFARKMSEFPWLDLMILISIFIWVIIVTCQILPHSYFQLVAIIFIVGWLRSALFLSFCSHWHGFVVSLQSSLSKYFISFIFVFIFIYIGFSFALRILLTGYDLSEKPFYVVAFKTLDAVFGMGNLDEIPDEVEESVGKAVFLKAVIVAYCSLVAILVLAIIRQPDTELVVRVGSELFPRLKLRLLKDIVWLMRWRRSRSIDKIGEPGFGSILYEIHEAFGIGGRTLKKINDKYVLRYYKEDVEDNDFGSGSENDCLNIILKQVRKIQSDLEKINKKLICSSQICAKQ